MHTDTHIFIFTDTYICVYLCSYPALCHRTAGLNSDFPFSKTGFLTKAKERTQSALLFTHTCLGIYINKCVCVCVCICREIDKCICAYICCVYQTNTWIWSWRTVVHQIIILKFYNPDLLKEGKVLSSQDVWNDLYLTTLKMTMVFW